MGKKGVVGMVAVGSALIAGGFSVSASLGIAASIGLTFSVAVALLAVVSQRRSKASGGEWYGDG